MRFQAQMGPRKPTPYLIETVAPPAEYTCYELYQPGQTVGASMDKLYAYILNGSEAHKDWEKCYKKKDKYNPKGGIWVSGKVYSSPNQNYNYPVGIIILSIEKP